jgi:hypothetical protein
MKCFLSAAMLLCIRVYVYCPSLNRAVSWLWRLVVGLSPRTPEVNSRIFTVGFVENQTTLGQVFLPLRQFPLPVSFPQCSMFTPICLPSTPYTIISCITLISDFVLLARLTLEDGTDTLSRNVGKQLPHDTA